MIIGITDCKRWDNYQKWFSGEKGIDVIRLSAKQNNLSEVEKCDGVVLSGGEDVHPRYYGHPEWMEKKEELRLEVDEVRDEFEMQVIDRAYKRKIPLLGICRGLQLANVYFKGTLIPDIGDEGRKKHTKEKGYDRMHPVQVEAGSCLSGIVGAETGKVNSAHHQAADKIGEGLRVTARSEDGTIEALEPESGESHPFILLVQWHPERVNQQENPFASGIKERFLKEVRKNAR